MIPSGLKVLPISRSLFSTPDSAVEKFIIKKEKKPDVDDKKIRYLALC